jgi:ubiquinone/menaquinone biosynthesis C-methylase UbiE
MEVFDFEAKHYDDWYKTKLGRFVDEIETRAVLKHLEGAGKIRVLDVGCGTGNYAIKLAQMGFEVVGVDKSTEMLKIARQKVKESGLSVELILCDARHLPFANEEFDAVISVATLEFISSPLEAVDEMFRVTRKGGKIIIGFINKDGEWGKLYQSSDFREKTVFRYADFFAKDEIAEMHPEELVEIVETLYTPPFVEDEEISYDNEQYFSKIYRASFLVGVWQKK